MNRQPLAAGTLLRFWGGTACYRITGLPIGEGGGSLIYPAEKGTLTDGTFTASIQRFAIKECYPNTPVNGLYSFIRTKSGKIQPATGSSQDAASFLNTAKLNQLSEERTTQSIYLTGFRICPSVEAVSSAELSFDNGSTFHFVSNVYTVMESLADKGESLQNHLDHCHRLSLQQAFRVTEQILYALEEVHKTHLHLDLQAGNIFIKGILEKSNSMATLIDFSSALPLDSKTGKCAPISNTAILTTKGYIAPEATQHNGETIQLGPEYDIYAVGCLLLQMLTGRISTEEERINTQDGHYLSRMACRYIHCPDYLLDRLQEIIAHTLKPLPENRYHTCEEMLHDVTAFLQALQPAKEPFSNVIYDAFISYRHNEFDRMVAKQLQTSLEHFHVPHSISEQRRPFHHIFLDEGELSCTADFGEAIRQALKNSHFLIVLCSQETPQSKWVNDEIKIFLEYHDRSRVLAVLTDGSPETSFPALLNADDNFAPPVRGKTKAETQKNIKKDTVFRAAAPMLGTTFESLKQRYKNYILKQALAFSAAGLVLLLAFLCYAINRTVTIRRQADTILQKDTELTSAYQATLTAQARYLSDLSIDLNKEGYRKKALQVALALGDGQELASEQRYALNTALHSYKTGLDLTYDAMYIGEANNITKGILTEDEQFYCAVDRDGNLNVLDPGTGDLIWCLTPGQMIEGADSDGVQKIYAWKDSSVVLQLEDQLVITDLKSQSILSTISDDYSAFIKKCKLSEDTLAAYTSDTLNLYSLPEGIEKAYVEFPEDTIRSVAFVDSCTFAIALESEGLVLWNSETNTTTPISAEPTYLTEALSNGNLIAVQPSYTDDTATWDDLTRYSIACYRQDGTLLFELADGTDYGVKEYAVTCNDESYSAVLLYLDNHFSLMDESNMETIQEFSFAANISDCYQLNEHCLLFRLSDNSMISYDLNDPDLGRTNVMSLESASSIFDSISYMDYCKSTDTIIYIVNNDVIFANRDGDPEMTCIDAEDEVLDVLYFTAGNDTYRCVLSGYYYVNYTGIQIYKAGSSVLLFSYSCTDGATIDADTIMVAMNDQAAQMVFVEKDYTDYDNRKLALIHADLTDGTVLRKEDLNLDPYFSYYTLIAFSEDLSEMYVTGQGGGLIRYDISGPITQKGNFLAEGIQFQEIISCSDSQYIGLLAADGSLQILDSTDQKITSAVDATGATSISAGKSSFIIYGGDSDKVQVYDAAAGKITFEIAVKTPSRCSSGFFANDRELIVVDDGIITLYELATGNVLSTCDFSDHENYMHVITGQDSEYFALGISGWYMDDSRNIGWTPEPLYLFYVDKDRQVYRNADICSQSYISTDGREVSVVDGDQFSYTHIYSFDDLYQKASEVIGSSELSTSDKKLYYITD